MRDLAAWVRYFGPAALPILAKTSTEIEALREIEENVNAGMLAPVIQHDPLLTIKFFANVASRRRKADQTETETVMSSLVMAGVAPFFRDFGVQLTVEDQLHAQPKALQGLMDVLTRSQRAAHFAMAFAVHRGDTDAEVIYQAALLHDMAEMLMWCHAPTLAMEIRAMQKANPTLRSAALQRFVYNIELDDLRQELMKIWRLPSLLVRVCDGKHPEHPSVRSVTLAVRLARHTTHGWDNAALPDDINDIALLLNSNVRVVTSFLRKIEAGMDS
jgi:HD-like signal output (HDOD) protein